MQRLLPSSITLIKRILPLILCLGIPLGFSLHLRRLTPIGRIIALGTWQYFFFPVLFIAAGIFLVLTRRRKLAWSREHIAACGLGVIISASVALTVCLVVRPIQWIQWDETALMATSQSMHLQRLNAYVSEAGVGDAFPPTLAQDQRPPLFPFLVSLAHDAVGMRIENAFLVNGAVLFLLLLLVFFSIYRWLGIVPAITAQFLLVSESVVLWCATSGGYDLLSLCLLLALVIAAVRLLERPELRSFSYFLFTGTLYSYTRYESVLIFFLVGFGCSWHLWRARKWAPRFSQMVALLPPLLTPLGLHAIQSGSYEGFYNNLQSQFAIPFRLAYLEKNLPDFLVTFFNFHPDGFFFGPLHLLGLGAFLLAFRDSNRKGIWSLFFLATCIAPLLIMCCFVVGSASSFVCLRLYLPITAFCALTPLFLLRIFHNDRLKFLLLLGSLVLFQWRLNVAIATRSDTFGYEGKAAVGLTQVLRQNQTWAAADSLYVFEVPAFILSRGSAAIRPATMRDHWREIKQQQERGKIGKIFFVDFFPANLKSSVSQLAKNFGTTEIRSLRTQEISVRLLELQKWPEVR